eukprot:s288_g31.t1
MFADIKNTDLETVFKGLAAEDASTPSLGNLAKGKLHFCCFKCCGRKTENDEKHFQHKDNEGPSSSFKKRAVKTFKSDISSFQVQMSLEKVHRLDPGAVTQGQGGKKDAALSLSSSPSLGGVFRKGNRWQDALILLGAMPSQAIQANIFSYSAAISACEKTGQWQQALQLFQTLQLQGVEANSISFNATISACEKAGEWQQALQIFQQMATDPWSNDKGENGDGNQRLKG